MLVGMERAVREMAETMRVGPLRPGLTRIPETPYAGRTSMIEAFGRTDVGRRRKINEDSYLVSPESKLYAVCDGMGGHNAGEVASKMAIETIEAFIQRSGVEKEITWPWGLDANLSFEGNRLKTAIRLANARVFQAADNREDLTGMGTTVVARWCPARASRSPRPATAAATWCAAASSSS